MREDDQIRYRFLETVREFGLRKLAASGRRAEAEAALRRWATSRADELLDQMYGPDQVVAVTAVRVEANTLVAQLRQALTEKDTGGTARLMAVLAGYWTIRGDHFAMLDLAVPVLDLLAEAGPPSEEERALWRGLVAACLIQVSVFTSTAPPAPIQLLRDLGAAEDGSMSDSMRTVALRVLTDPDARDALTDVATSGADPQAAWMAWGLLSHLRENSGDLRGAIAASHEVLALADTGHGPWFRAVAVVQLGTLHASLGELDKGAAYANEGLPAFRLLGAEGDAIQLRCMVAMAQIAAGNLAEAEEELRELQAEIDTADVDQDAVASLLSARGEAALARGQVDEGLALFHGAMNAVEEITRRLGDKLALAGGTPDAPVIGPWEMHGIAVLVFAHVLHERLEEVGPTAGRLESLLRRQLQGAGHDADFPVVGSALLALGAWRLSRGDRVDAAVRMIALGYEVGYNRLMPVMAWENALTVVHRHQQGAQLEQALVEVGELESRARLDRARELLG